MGNSVWFTYCQDHAMLKFLDMGLPPHCCLRLHLSADCTSLEGWVWADRPHLVPVG